MNNKFFKITVIIASIAILFSACKKDEDSTPDNPLNGKTTAVFNSSVSYGTMTDQDGNIYKIVTIGTQTWMAENLRTTKYNDGTKISYDAAGYLSLSSGTYCNYNNTTSEDTIATYGRLYNWHAVNTGKLAPTGWHVPTIDEWTILTTFLGGESVAGGKLKETGTTHWSDPNTGATNETGFTALPGGYSNTSGANIINYSGYWWSASEYTVGGAFFKFMFNNHSDVYWNDGGKQVGYSVRCVRD